VPAPPSVQRIKAALDLLETADPAIDAHPFSQDEIVKRYATILAEGDAASGHAYLSVAEFAEFVTNTMLPEDRS
jgi:hypothetical protein